MACLLGFLASASLAALSGTVKTSSGSGLAGVSVSLGRASASAVATDASGQWSIASVSVGGRAQNRRLLPNHLSLENGRLSIAFDGISADGRRLAGPSSDMEGAMAAGRTLAVVDTLLFKLGGVVKARLAIGKYDSTGIVTVIDTATSAVDEGTSVTNWASGCATAKVPCASGTWQLPGPDYDHSGYKLIKESSHFVIYSDETVSDATASSALDVMENTVWKNLFESNLFMPEPYCKSSTKYKAAIHVHSGWGLTGGGWGSDRIGMWIGPDALSDHWGLAHEFTHSWQTANNQGGGMACNQSNTCGWIHESHANFTPHQLSEYSANVHCSEMLANAPHLYLGSTRDRYCNWQFMEYLKDKYCPSAVNDMWTTSGADPFTNLQKSRGWSVSQLNDFFGDWAMHNVVWDYKATPGAFRNTYGNITLTNKSERMRRLMPLEALDDSWATDRRFVSPFHGAPQRFGYNVVRLYPVDGASTVAVTFRGIDQSGSNADFRWGLVATNTGFTTARYSKLQSGLDGKVIFKVNSGEPLFLVVVATPSTFQTITWDQEYNTIWRYPYMIELANAWPAGFQNGARDVCPSGTQRHANGGGCAPSSTPASVYVGPYATVLSGGKVSGGARIEDQAIIVNGSVTGGTVGGLSIVGMTGGDWGNNTFNVSGSATVRTAFYPLGYFEGGQSVSGTTNLYGDVEFRGEGTSRSSGNLSGYVDASSTTGTATDRNSKGPWTWRN